MHYFSTWSFVGLKSFLFFFFFKYLTQLFSGLISRVLLFCFSVGGAKVKVFLFSLACTTGASTVSLGGMASTVANNIPYSPKSSLSSLHTVVLVSGHYSGGGIYGRLWVFWPVCSWHYLLIARSSQQCCSVGEVVAGSRFAHFLFYSFQWF